MLASRTCANERGRQSLAAGEASVAEPLCPRNRLLQALPAGDWALLRPHAERVPIASGEILIEAQAPITYVHFPEYGLLSVIARSGSDDGAAEVGLIGSEGMSGIPAVLGLERDEFETLVQSSGVAYRVACDRFRYALQQSPSLRPFLLRYVHVFMVQIAETARANSRLSLEQRLARWLAMAHDRSRDDDIALTHEFLATMLGVRRSGVTVALHCLEGEHIIRARRGRLRVMDREALEAAAGDSYGRSEAEYRRLISHPIGAVEAALAGADASPV